MSARNDAGNMSPGEDDENASLASGQRSPSNRKKPKFDKRSDPYPHTIKNWGESCPDKYEGTKFIWT